MDELATDRSLKRLKLDPASLADIVEILSRKDRRAIVKIDDHKLDDPTHADAATLASAKTVDVVSYWVNPDHPHWGRRHFVYLASSPQGAQYFGDSQSAEVTAVLEALDAYFGKMKPALVADTATPAGFGSGSMLNPAGRFAQRLGRPGDDSAVLALLVGVGLMIAVLAFFIGRWSVSSGSPSLEPTPLSNRPVPTQIDPEPPTTGT